MKIQIKKLNNLLQNFDYISTIISTIKYLKIEKTFGNSRFILLQIKSKILKLQIFAQTSFAFIIYDITN